eukprot:TRINITY_DN7043_c0_g1_i1.p1 TRINITY_DN7043_c0_g1~~TRINITY_DN7043_c0_g1_i1.p1  ORF type:complete len:150 (-),score=22.22 TRINITY_DN7043_c0_g1_i1:25-474(-)
MVLVSKAANPIACREFEAEVLVLYHQTTISKNYEAVVHCGTAQQCARIIDINGGVIRTGDKAKVRFRFVSRPEFLIVDNRLIFREGRAKGIGRITQIFPVSETDKHVAGGTAPVGAPAAPGQPPVTGSAGSGRGRGRGKPKIEKEKTVT